MPTGSNRVLVQIGDKFGMLTVVSEPFKSDDGKRVVRCICTCGNERLMVTDARARTKWCERCANQARRDGQLTHGESHSPLSRRWSTIKGRCYEPLARCYNDYGGRGITVCEEWRDSYEKFRDWALANGYAPGLQIDRIDNDGNYEPDNCRWVTNKVNANNKRTNRTVTAFGETKTIAEWSEDGRCTVGYSALIQRIVKCGWDAERALTEPSHLPSCRKPAKRRNEPLILETGLAEMTY